MRGYPGFDLGRFQDMLLNVFYPMNDDFLTNHNGACITNYWANWDLCNMASILAIGILCDDQAKFDRAVDYFKNGAGNGVDLQRRPVRPRRRASPSGRRAGRDQGHTIMGIGLMGAFCEMAWNQGIDLYGYDDNRFLKAAEYVAKYNLGAAPSPRTMRDGRTARHAREQTRRDARGEGRPMWELVYNHYGVRRGLSVPYIAAYGKRVPPKAEAATTAAQVRPPRLRHPDLHPSHGRERRRGRPATDGRFADLRVGQLPEGVHPGRSAAGRIGATALPLRIVPGLADAKGYSFVDSEGRYLRHKDFLVRFDANNGTALFKHDATFTPARARRPGRCGWSRPTTRDGSSVIVTTSCAWTRQRTRPCSAPTAPSARPPDPGAAVNRMRRRCPLRA